MGKDFHPACVEALERALARRNEVYGEGHEDQRVVYDVPPPASALGSTLDDQAVAAANTSRAPRHAPRVRQPAPAIPRDAVVVAALAVAAIVSGAAAATPIALAALVTAGEIVALRPLRRAPRPLSLVVMLVAVRVLSLSAAAITIGAGEVAAFAVHRLARTLLTRAATAAAMLGTYAALATHGPGFATVPATLITLAVPGAAALATLELAEGHGNRRLDLGNRLADLALLASAPLVALGVAGTNARSGLGLGALAVLIVPLALLTHGLLRTQRAHENLYAWIRAVSVAPEHAALVPEGHAARVVHHARVLAAERGLDVHTREQLEAAAWIERVGECCLDDRSVTGQPHAPAVIAEASAAILASCAAFETAVAILRTAFADPQHDADGPIADAGRVLRTAVDHASPDYARPKPRFS
ncbi:MAG TPA: hypothetical protein VN636_13920, partial [Acidimicrobiia bacterium]|nr:hypothetical protein [Acidimicrobiia bacterium]